MIQAMNVSKQFGSIRAVDTVSAEIREGAVFGLIGSNGAGKSTFLRMLAGILKPDTGSVLVDGADIYENAAVKGRIFYIADEQYFLPNATPGEMRRFYKQYYPKFDDARFEKLMNSFQLEQNRKIRTFSKGMKKQISVICGLCAGVDYLFCDETFDGLDPVVRQAVKSLFAADIAERGLTPVIASHNLRELEDICDHVGLLHKGGILFSRELEEMKLGIHKVQCVFKDGFAPGLFEGFEILKTEQRGTVYTITVRGGREAILDRIAGVQPVFFELVPLSLEEIFINETEVIGYDIKTLIL